MSRDRSKGAAGQDGVEMGERSALGQEPGYNGLCSYTQKITSCFGLDGKARARREDGGVVQGAEITSGNIWHVSGVRCCSLFFYFFLRRGGEVGFPRACMCCFFASARVGADDSFGGQCCAAAESHVLTYSQVHVSACVGGRLSQLALDHPFL